MIVVTGGAYQGKSKFAETLREEKQRAGAGRTEIVFNLQNLIAEQMRAGADPYACVKSMTEKNPDLIVTVNELGCGIVPMDPFDREWREVTGRISCMLAERAEEVYRVTCGIAVRIR